MSLCVRTTLLFAVYQLCACALNPNKSLTQYSVTVWTQQQGLPQDVIRAVTQTSDGFIWLGTDEGLARFDGYQFAPFGNEEGGVYTKRWATRKCGFRPVR